MNDGGKILIQVSFYAYEGENFFNNVADKISKIYTGDDIYFISVLININNFRYPSKVQEYDKVKFVVLETSEVWR